MEKVNIWDIEAVSYTHLDVYKRQVLDIMGLKKYKKTDDAGKFNREEEEKE